MDQRRLEQIKEGADAAWVAGVDAYFALQQTEHVERLKRTVGEKDPTKTYISPSKSSLFVNANGVPQLEGLCHRDIFFKSIRMRETNPRSAAVKRKLLTGQLVERVEHEIEKLSGRYVGSNELITYKVDDKTEMIAETDSRLKDDWGDIYVKEIKVIFGYQAKRNHITGTKKIIPHPRWSAVLQLSICIAMLGVKYGVLKFIDGTTMMEERSYVIELKDLEHAGRIVDKIIVVDGAERDDIRLSGIMSRFMALALYMRDKKLPPRECSVAYSDRVVDRLLEGGVITKNRHKEHMEGNRYGDWQCRLCTFKDLCMSQDRAIAKEVEEKVKENEKKGGVVPSGEPDSNSAVW